jgi:uncharacterized protein (UPF0305 family)
MRVCPVCDAQIATGGGLCRLCKRSYDAMLGGHGDIMSVIVWASKRARWYARRTKRSPRP